MVHNSTNAERLKMNAIRWMDDRVMKGSHKDSSGQLFSIYLQGAKEQDWLNIETMEKVDEGSYLPNCQ